MGITGMRVFRVKLPYVEPFRIALGTSTFSENVVVELLTDWGDVGYGEGCPSRRIMGENIDMAIAEILERGKEVVGSCPMEFRRLEEKLSSWKVQSAKAAVEMAVLDLVGKLTKKPLFKLLGGYRDCVETDVTIGIDSPEKVGEKAVKWRERGFKILKIKLGTDPEEDKERLRAVRDALGYDVSIRVDANQGWSFKQAKKMIPFLERNEVDLLEQPLPYDMLEKHAELRKATDIPIALDESVKNSRDALKAVALGAADVINIKLMKCGGIWEGIRILHVCEAAGLSCMVGCVGESRLGLTAATHLAASSPVVRYADVDSDFLLARDLVTRGGISIGPKRKLPDAPGLGVLEIDEEMLEFVAEIE